MLILCEDSKINYVNHDDHGGDAMTIVTIIIILH